jgi:GNAT superfamily N-acetyltransferase
MTHIRTASSSDVPELVRVINAAYEVEKFFVAGDRTDLESVRRMLGTGTFLAVDVDGHADRLSGCVYVELRDRRGYFGMLSVDPAAQGRGLGRLLVEAAEALARARQCTAMDIRVVDLRLELPAFYRRLGYTETGVAEAANDPRALRPFQFVEMSKRL